MLPQNYTFGIQKNKSKQSIQNRKARASTSVDAKSCKTEKTLYFTHFDQKNTHISGCKIVHKCTSVTLFSLQYYCASISSHQLCVPFPLYGIRAILFWPVIVLLCVFVSCPCLPERLIFRYCVPFLPSLAPP